MKDVSENKRRFGTLGEQFAKDFLKSKGYKIIWNNFRAGRIGEIDIIAKDGEYLCFIEVKARSSDLYGTPAESVNKKKQKNIIRIAQVYLERYQLHDANVRFDVIEVYVEKKNGLVSIQNIQLIKEAFYST